MNKHQIWWLQEFVNTPILIIYQPENKQQFLIHYLTVLSFMVL